MAEREYFCDKSLKPWIAALIVLTALLIGWIMLKKEEIMLTGAGEEARSFIKEAIPADEKAFINPAQLAALPNPYPSRHYGVAAITKATPKGGIQLVANPTQTGFQNSLKDAVNSIIPSVCDVHAMWINRSGSGAGARNPKSLENLQFLPPFDGVIDKFVRNKGYENIGAGIIVDESGFILTNHHVVENATDIVVTVPGNPPMDYEAVNVAHDVMKDLALLKIKARNVTFPEARLGDSTFCEIGDYVIAVGSPFGMEQTVTSGIISGIRKSINIAGIRYENLFQTDAPINRGSSGGPLVNLGGEVIGITTAIYAPTGVFNGTGFVIPINDAKEFLSHSLGRNYPLALDRKGLFREPLLNKNNLPFDNPLPIKFGIEAISINPVIAKHLGTRENRGILINRVLPDSPASFTGIQRGDIITSIAGTPVNNTRDIPGIVSHFKPGDNVNMRFTRNGRENEALIKLW